jgi:hypothetical protein
LLANHDQVYVFFVSNLTNPDTRVTVLQTAFILSARLLENLGSSLKNLPP